MMMMMTQYSQYTIRPSINYLFQPQLPLLPGGLVTGKNLKVWLLLWWHWDSLDRLKKIITGHIGRKSGQKFSKLNEIKMK